MIDPVKSGVVKAGAGAGKTIIGAAALCTLAERQYPKPLKVAWIAHTKEQVQQAREACVLFWPPNLTVEFHCYAAGPWIGDCDVVVADEVHRLPAETFRKIVDGFEGIRFGLSATPEREDDLKGDVFDLIGPVIYEIDRDQLVAEGHLCPCKVTFLEANEFDEYDTSVSEIADTLIEERRRKWPILFCNPARANEQIRRATWQAVLQEAIYNNPKRDAAIAEICRRHVGETVLIIVGSVDHGTKLVGMIPGAEVCHAKLSKKKREAIMARAKSGELKVLVATSLADEGLDLPIASVLILAAPSKSKNKAEQRTGRVLRTFEGKDEGRVYDFNDIQHSYLRGQSHARLKAYEKLGYEISVENIEHIPVPSVEDGYTQSDYSMSLTTEPVISDQALKEAMASEPKLAHADREHSRHSPSSLEQILRCGGFVNDSDRDTTAADRGTLGHEAVEKNNPALCGADDTLRKAVELCIKYREKLRKGAKTILQEKRVKVIDQAGSFDELIIHPDNTAHLIDYKFAYNAYHADGMQAKAYVLGCFDEFPSIKEIKAHFILPFRSEVSVQRYTREDYETIVTEVRAVIERARKADPADFRANKYCAYCARAGACPVLGKIAIDLAARYADEEIKVPEGAFETHGSKFTDPVIAGELMKIAPIVEKAAESWRRGGLRLRIEDGVDIPGWKLVTAKGRRSVTNPSAAFEVLSDRVSAEEFIAISSVPIGKLEEVYSSKAPKGKKAAWVAELSDKLADASAISEGMSIHKLVPEKVKSSPASHDEGTTKP
jgi:superfamily II DNA or RNA helicase